MDALLPPLVLTGGPAAGKSTTARALATERARAAFVDVDDVRQLVVAGAVAPWQGAEGRRQHALGARNTGALGRGLLDAGFDVTVADLVTAATLPEYRAALPGCFVVHLALPLAEARTRALTRPVHLTADEFDLLHAIAADPPPVDLVLHVAGMTEQEQCDAVRAAWMQASG